MLEELTPALVAMILYIMLRLGERDRRCLMGLIAEYLGKGHVMSPLSEISGMGVSTLYKAANQVRPLIDLVMGIGDQFQQARNLLEEAFSLILDGKEGDGYIAPAVEQTYYEATSPAGTNPEVDAMQKPKPRGRKRKHKKDRRAEAKRRQRRIGAGAKQFAARYTKIYADIFAIVKEYIAGNPMGPGLYVGLSLAHIRDALLKIREENGELRYPSTLSIGTVRFIMIQMGFSLQRNKKMAPPIEYHKDRDLQFKTIKAMNDIIWDLNVVLLSMDEKKAEDMGNFAVLGPEWREIGNPRITLTYNFPNGMRAIPYGIYDVKKNLAYITIGTSRSTSEFATNCLLYYLKNIAPTYYPDFKTVVITCDGGGNNSSRSRMWKADLAKIAKELGITIFVFHYPPYTSKYNKIEHRVFSEISKNWRGHPLVDLDTMKHFIESTTTKTGLKIECFLDSTEYETGRTLSSKELKKLMNEHVNIFDSNGWNYMISGEANPLEDKDSDASAIAKAIQEVIVIPEAENAVDSGIAAVFKAKKDVKIAEEKVAEKTKIYEAAKQLAEDEAAKAASAMNNGDPDADSRMALANEYKKIANNHARALGRLKSTAAKRTAVRDEALTSLAKAISALFAARKAAESSCPEGISGKMTA